MPADAPSAGPPTQIVKPHAHSGRFLLASVTSLLAPVTSRLHSVTSLLETDRPLVHSVTPQLDPCEHLA
jgi:hypothetical protein